MKWLLSLVGGRLITVLLGAVLTGGAWYFVDDLQDKRREVQELSATIEQLKYNNTVIKDQLENISQLLKKKESQNKILNKHWDAVKERYREVNNEKANEYRNNVVPDDIIDGLLNGEKERGN